MKKLKLDENLSAYIEGLNFSVEAYKAIISYMIVSKKNIESESFLNFQKKYEREFMKFELAKYELEKMLSKGSQKKVDRWKLDYSTCEVTYE